MEAESEQESTVNSHCCALSSVQLLFKSHLQKQPEKSSAEISEIILFCYLTCKVILAVGRPDFVFSTAGRGSSSYNSQRRVSNPLHSINQHLTGKGLIASGHNSVIMWSNFALLGGKPPLGYKSTAPCT